MNRDPISYMRKAAISLIPISVAVISLTACTSTESPPVDDTSPSHQSQSEPLGTLAGSEWGYGDGSDRFVGFQQDGRLQGSGGCNRFFGQYSREGEAIQIGPLASTKKMCAPDIMSGEQSLMQALSRASRIDVTHLSLILYSDNGTTLVTLQRRDWD